MLLLYGQYSYSEFMVGCARWSAARALAAVRPTQLKDSRHVEDGAALGAAVPVSIARAEASRRNGAKSRGPKTAEGKARSARNALRHGMRALQYVVLPDEDAVQFQRLEAALLDELAPEGACSPLARRVAVAAWRLARADRMEVELFEERRWEDAGAGMALIRDGNGTQLRDARRYRSAAMAEFGARSRR